MDQKDKDGLDPYPESPDIKRVHQLRERLHRDQAGTGGRPGHKAGNTARDIGTYTLIPSLMVAGPLVGYVLGRAVEKYIGGEPWGAVIGMLAGVVAAFRQVYLLLKRKSEK